MNLKLLLIIDEFTDIIKKLLTILSSYQRIGRILKLMGCDVHAILALCWLSIVTQLGFESKLLAV